MDEDDWTPVTVYAGIGRVTIAAAKLEAVLGGVVLALLGHDHETTAAWALAGESGRVMRTLGKLVRGMPPDHPIRVLRDDVRLAFERRNGLVHSVVVRQVMHDGQPSEPLWFHPKTLALTPVNEGVAADLLADLNELTRRTVSLAETIKAER